MVDGKRGNVRVLRKSIQLELFFSHFFAVLLVSGSIGTYFFYSANENVMQGLQDRLRYSAAMISQSVDASEIRDIQSKADISRPGYLSNLEKLREFRRMNTDIAYIYIMRRMGDQVVFVIDSDETSRQAFPGKVYENIVPALFRGFTGISVDDKIVTDEWGMYLSGYSPIRNGMGEYLIGIDMRADEVGKKFGKLRISGIVSLSCSILLALLFSRYLAGRFMIPIRALMARCESITRGKLDERVIIRSSDELEQLVGAFNVMSDSLSTSEKNHHEALENLRRTRDELEIRVEQRTKDLKEINERLGREIIERVRAEQALEVAAMTDPLTGLLNRRATWEHFKHEVFRFQRTGDPFVILLADLDFFKRINDTDGHDAGDKILIEVGRRLEKIVRGQDIISRWGGEEFLILLPETAIDGGMVLAEKIRANIEREPFIVDGKKIPLTLSIGVSVFSSDKTIEECIKSADEALYRAKNSGKNRIATVSIA